MVTSSPLSHYTSPRFAQPSRLRTPGCTFSTLLSSDPLSSNQPPGIMSYLCPAIMPPPTCSIRPPTSLHCSTPFRIALTLTRLCSTIKVQHCRCPSYTSSFSCSPFSHTVPIPGLLSHKGSALLGVTSFHPFISTYPSHPTSGLALLNHKGSALSVSLLSHICFLPPLSPYTSPRCAQR